MTGRPKAPKTARNKNVLVIGGSGSGKTRFFVKPTVERLRFAEALAPDPAAKKLFFTLAVKLSDESCDRWYRCFFYNMRLEVEHFAHHKYHSDSQPISVMTDNARNRANGPECILCMECVKNCPKTAL